MMFVTDEMSLKRVGKLRRKMNEMSVDAYLVTNPSNRYYLSGFTGDDGVLLVILASKSKFLMISLLGRQSLQEIT